jgi:signal transduction histidine kinase
VTEQEFDFVRKDGYFLPVSLYVKPVYADKKFNGMLGIAVDISEQKAIREELIQAKERAEESDRLKSAFLANMSHEIRTPMNGIIGFSQMISREGLSKEKRIKFGEIIQDQGKQLLVIISDIIDISKIEAGQLKIEKDVFSLNDMMSKLYDTFVFLAEKESKRVKIIACNGLPDDDAFLYSDHGRIEQILSNLLSNAIKFTEEGKIRFGYQKQGEEALLFFVQDTGIGLSPKEQRLIFERFRQVESSYQVRQQGTGLGLSISQGLVQLLGGDIWVESRKDKGSAFYFTIPFHREKI